MDDPPKETDQTDQTDSNFVEQLVFQCLDSKDVDAAAEEVCDRHPEVAVRVRQVLERLRSEGLLADSSDHTAAFVPAQDDFEIPERLGHFRMLSRLGAGGMGVVYLAEDEKLGRQVAVKIVRPEQLYFPGARERFQREIEAIARLHHPGIVTIHSVGEENGVPYFSMDYVRGSSLAQVIASLAADDPARLRSRDLDAQLGRGSSTDSASSDGLWSRVAIRIVRDVAEALDHAHRQGVVHRDVKPSNILIGEDRRPRLLDFGLARTEDAQQLTRSTSHLGSLPYMAPEQLEGTADMQAPTLDVYALGVTMYELLAFRSPYLGPTAEETRSNILAASPRSLRAANSSVGSDLETVCRTAMDPNPARRYQGMSAFMADLDNLLAMRPIVARPAGHMLRAVRWCQRHPTATVGIGMAVVLFVVAIGFAAVQASNVREAQSTNYLLGIMAARSQLDAGRVREANASLDLCPTHLRRFEWDHLQLLANSSAGVFRGHTARILWVEIHPDGQEFASASEDGTVRLWNIEENESVRTLRLDEKRRVAALCCCYSADGEFLFCTSNDGKVRRWKRDGSDEKVLIHEEHGRVTRIAADPTGPRLACGYDDGRVQILDANTGSVVCAIEMFENENPDTVMGEKLTPSTQALAFSPDGQELFAGQVRHIAVIDVQLRKQVRKLRHGKDDLLTTIGVIGEGTSVLSGGTHGELRIWDRESGAHIKSETSRTLAINSACHDNATQRIFVAGKRGVISVFGEDLKLRYSLLGHEGNVTQTALTPDGKRLLTASYDATIRVWHTDAEPAVQVAGRHKDMIRTLEVTPDSRHAITGGKDSLLAMWDLQAGTKRDLTPNPGVGIQATSLSADGRRLLAIAGDLFLIELEGSEPARKIASPVPLKHVVWMPDGRSILAGSARGKLWRLDADSGKVLAANTDWFGEERTTASGLVLCPTSGQVVLSTTGGRLVIFDAGSLSFERKVHSHDYMIYALAFDPATRSILSADVRGNIRFTDPGTGARSADDTLFKDEIISSFSVSPDRERLITSTMGRQIQIWERDGMRPLTRLSGHYKGVLKTRFTPDGKKILSVSMDGTLRVWDSER